MAPLGEGSQRMFLAQDSQQVARAVTAPDRVEQFDDTRKKGFKKERFRRDSATTIPGTEELTAAPES